MGQFCRDFLQEFICCRKQGQELTVKKNGWNRKHLMFLTVLSVMFVGFVVRCFSTREPEADLILVVLNC